MYTKHAKTGTKIIENTCIMYFQSSLCRLLLENTNNTLQSITVMHTAYAYCIKSQCDTLFVVVFKHEYCKIIHNREQELKHIHNHISYVIFRLWLCIPFPFVVVTDSWYEHVLVLVCNLERVAAITVHC